MEAVNNVNEYLSPLIDEVVQLVQNSYKLQEKVYNIKIRAFRVRFSSKIISFKCQISFWVL